MHFHHFPGESFSRRSTLLALWSVWLTSYSSRVQYIGLHRSQFSRQSLCDLLWTHGKKYLTIRNRAVCCTSMQLLRFAEPHL